MRMEDLRNTSTSFLSPNDNIFFPRLSWLAITFAGPKVDIMLTYAEGKGEFTRWVGEKHMRNT